MKNKTVILILSVLAVAMYTVAVINFCLGNVLGGIGDVLMACSDALMAYALYRVGQLGRMADTTRKAVIGLLELLAKGVPATLTIKDGKGTITLGHDDDGDTGEAPEDDLFVARTFITYDMTAGLQAEDFNAHRQHILTDREMYERAKEWYR